jgi:hypothetical protein
MTRTPEPPPVAEPSPRRIGRLPTILLGLLSLLLLLVGVLERRQASLGPCCAIECLDTPDPAACMRREQGHARQLEAADSAEKAAVAAFAGSAIALGAALVLLVRR